MNEADNSITKQNFCLALFLLGKQLQSSNNHELQIGFLTHATQVKSPKDLILYSSCSCLEKLDNYVLSVSSYYVANKTSRPPTN